MGMELIWDKFIDTVGVSIGFCVKIINNIYYNLLGTEIGYRVFNGRNTFYFSVKCDFIIFMYSIAAYVK